MRPRAYFAMKLMASGVTCSAGDGDVTLVFPIFVVDKNDHPALRVSSTRFFNTANSHNRESSASLILKKAVFAQEFNRQFPCFRLLGGEAEVGSHHVAGHTCR